MYSQLHITRILQEYYKNLEISRENQLDLKKYWKKLVKTKTFFNNK